MTCASGDSLLAELDCLRQKLAEVERERDAYKSAHQLVTEECSHWASETAKHRDFLAKYIEVATEREQELGMRCVVLESRLQAATAQDDLFSLLMNVAQLLNTLEEQQRATKWTRQIKGDVDKRLEAMDKVKEEAR